MNIIEYATQADIEDISQLLSENQLPYQDLGPHVELYLVRTEKKLAGVVGVEVYPPYALFRSLAVSGQYRNLGLGKQLTIFLLDYLAVHGITHIYLLTTTAEVFFDKIGFKKIDRKKVPTVIAQTKEFSAICPDSAVCMYYEIL